MKRFQNQSLSKTEMNHVRGGLAVFACVCNFAEELQRVWIMPENSSASDIANAINSHCTKGGSCSKVSA